ncbi:MAG: hypothetical protein N3A38_15810, partial [Planctomycetota bacterium]|nr:hypothetical protein [Planctomycetota bacterium]
MKLFEWLQMMPESKPWTGWREMTGEMPPDYDSMPSRHALPDVLAGSDGTRVSSPDRWPARREMWMSLLKKYAIGTYPDPPKGIEARIVSEVRENRAVRREMELSFGPENSGRRATLWMEMVVPEGAGPMPVFLTQHYHVRWARIAASRGYIAVRFAGSDSRDETGIFAELWPEYDWTKLTRRAWAASRCLDYILSLPEVDGSKVAMAGHSRNGKQTLIASAMDPRISAAISSSSGVGGACPYRLFSEAQMGEGIELITRVFPDWLHPRLRYFAGFEHKLPIDANVLVAMTAPRACLISTALNDNVESTYAIEECVRSALPAYELLGVPD